MPQQSIFPKYVLAFALPRKLPIAARVYESGPLFYLSDGRGGAVSMGSRTYTQTARGFLAALRDHVGARAQAV